MVMLPMDHTISQGSGLRAHRKWNVAAMMDDGRCDVEKCDGTRRSRPCFSPNSCGLSAVLCLGIPSRVPRSKSISIKKCEASSRGMYVLFILPGPAPVYSLVISYRRLFIHFCKQVQRCIICKCLRGCIFVLSFEAHGGRPLTKAECVRYDVRARRTYA